MLLTEALVPDYVDLVHPDLSPEDRHARVDRLRARLTDERPDSSLPHVTLGADGRVSATLRLHEPEPGVLVMTMPRTGRGGDASPLVAELIAKARALGHSRIQTRQDRGRLTPAFRSALDTAGFVVTDERLEHRTPVADLPREEETPFVWRHYTELPLDELGALFEAACAGPSWIEGEVGVELIRGYLAQEGFTSGPDCIQVGDLEGEHAAIVVGQVERSSGWCTLSFLGLMPERRGQGLGAHVHLRGFEMLRAQGGTLYQGGTSRENTAMRRLFERHGCELDCELLDLELVL